MLERQATKHKANVDSLMKLQAKRDKALDALIKAELRYRDAIRMVGRSQRRLDKARQEERKAKRAGKRVEAESRQELPDIASLLAS